MREETVGGSPAPDGDTPRPAEAGEKPRERHPSVFVLDRHGAPLQPCHPARARKLLGKGRAVVARHTPLVIRLKDRTIAESTVEGVELGIDPGSRHTAIAVFTATGGERRGRFAVRLDHRGAQIRRKLQQRADFRHGRRTRSLRYRAPRHDNRARREGWLAPSLRRRVDTTVAWVDRLARWAPVTAVHVESVAFDTHAISSGGPLEGAEYQHGTLHGTEVREYLRTRCKRARGYRGATGVPLNVDHVRPPSRGGSDRVSSLVLACVPCNQEKANRPVEDRILNHLPKTHTLDALAVGELGAVTETDRQPCTDRRVHRAWHTRPDPQRRVRVPPSASASAEAIPRVHDR
ncbi:RNA-guided endonuclease IscB [Streptomyces sp. MJM1172]|uniref:RNA-guided endonuclease IscB n=1 Tax=Streptomyces sp. MJM1172 TaxID=1703926 RepID=UPI00093ADF46|nr:RNA-guided endonuclease IscB [Streptomyces sp. MJM1172]